MIRLLQGLVIVGFVVSSAMIPTSWLSFACFALIGFLISCWIEFSH